MSLPWTPNSEVRSEEVHDSRRETWGEGEEDFTAQVQLQTDWSDRYVLVEEMHKHLQGRWPFFGSQVPTEWGYAYMASTSTQPAIEAAGVVSGQQAYDYSTALVTVRYSSNRRPYFWKETWEPKSEFRVQPYFNYQWPTDLSGAANPTLLTDQKEAPGIQIESSSYTVIWSNIPEREPVTGRGFNVSNIMDLNGKVNAAMLTYQDDTNISVDPNRLGGPSMTYVVEPQQALALISNVKKTNTFQNDWSSNVGGFPTGVPTSYWSFVLKLLIKKGFNPDQTNDFETWNTFFRREKYEKMQKINDDGSASNYNPFQTTSSIAIWVPPTWV